MELDYSTIMEQFRNNSRNSNSTGTNTRFVPVDATLYIKCVPRKLQREN